MNKKITREILLYILFGAGTTVINVVAYSVLYYSVGILNTWSTMLSWGLAVLFSYVTNRIWVFESQNKKATMEAVYFFLSRIATGALDLVIMYVGVEQCKFEGVFVKIFSNVLVIVLNFVACKFLIFKNR